MGTLYIGGQKRRKNGGLKWKILIFFCLSLALVISTLRFTAPVLVEKWINQKGASENGYAYSVRDVKLSLDEGKIALNDLKIFNPENGERFLETPELKVQLNWQNVLLSDEKIISVSAENLELILSHDLASEMRRIQDSTFSLNNDIYLKLMDGKIAKLRVYEKSSDLSRKMLELNDVRVRVKEASLHSVNKKTEFQISSLIHGGGELKLTGNIMSEVKDNPWDIQGKLTQVPSDIFNKIAGDKLPFAFLDDKLDAGIKARSEKGLISGEILPAIEKLNLLKERAGGRSHSITRALSEDLKFTLPFTLKDKVKLQYEDTFKRLVTYRKYPASPVKSAPSRDTGPEKTSRQKSSSWTF